MSRRTDDLRSWSASAELGDGKQALGVCRACGLAAPPGCRSRHENAAWSLTVRYGDLKTMREKCGVSGEEKAGRAGRRDSSVALRRRRRLAAKPGGGVERRPESVANAGDGRCAVWPNVGFGVFSGCFQRREIASASRS